MSVKHNPLKKVIKHGLQKFAAAYGRHSRPVSKPELLILMYHRILPKDDKRVVFEEPGMLVTPDTLTMHINTIKQYFEIIKLSKWIQLKRTGAELPERACVITFDDGWADNYEYAFPVLQELEAPATIYLVADMIGTNIKFWPERLAHTLATIAQHHAGQWSHPSLDWIKEAHTSYQFTTLPPTQDELSELIASAKELSDEDIHTRFDRINNELHLPAVDSTPSLLNWEQIAEMSASSYVEFGSHTCRHIRLGADTPADILKHEIIASKQTIETHTRQPVSTFCFPNGDYSPQALELVRNNYEGAVSTLSGWNSVASDNHLLHRIAIHEDIAGDRTAFLARISGWM